MVVVRRVDEGGGRGLCGTGAGSEVVQDRLRALLRDGDAQGIVDAVTLSRVEYRLRNHERMPTD